MADLVANGIANDAAQRPDRFAERLASHALHLV